MAVLRHGLVRHAADLLERAAPYDGTGPAEEGGVPHVVALLGQAVEQQALVGHRALAGQVPLERVGAVEMMRGLHQSDAAVAFQPADRELQKGAGGGVVAVEDGDVLASGVAHGMVEIAGLRPFVVRPDDVATADLLGEVAEFLTPAVIEDPDLQPVAWPVHRHGGEHGGAHQFQRLVVGGDVDIHLRPQIRVGRQRHRLALQRIGGLDIGQGEQATGVKLGGDQARGEDALEHALEHQRV